MQLVEPGNAVMIDDSTTALALVELLPTRGPLSVISNSLPVINKMSKEPGIDLIALGGAYYPAYDAFLGMRTGDAIRSLRANWCSCHPPPSPTASATTSPKKPSPSNEP